MEARSSGVEREARLATVVNVILAVSPSIRTAREALIAWAGHPHDPQFRTEAIALLDRIATEVTRRAA